MLVRIDIRLSSLVPAGEGFLDVLLCSLGLWEVFFQNPDAVLCAQEREFLTNPRYHRPRPRVALDFGYRRHRETALWPPGGLDTSRADMTCHDTRPVRGRPYSALEEAVPTF